MSNNDLPKRPHWLSDEILKKCVSEDVGASTPDDVVIKNFELEYAIGKGENFCSSIIRAIVHYDIENKRHNSQYQNGHGSTVNQRKYIVKIIPDSDELFQVLLDKHGILPREIDMYETTLPRFQDILKNAGLDTVFGCRCFYSSIKNRVLILEDLGDDKYLMVNRAKGLDLDHFKLALKDIARFHGASMKHYEQNGYNNVHDFYNRGMISRVEDEKFKQAIDPLLGRTFFRVKNTTLAENLANVPGYEREADVIKNLADHAHDILCEIFKRKPENVLNAHLHGDYWTNNLMFKYDDKGKPIDVKMIDLQFGNINSVTNDLMYFFLTSAADDLREFRYSELVNYYYKNLIETLNKVGYKRTLPTLQQLQEQMVVSSSIFFFILGNILHLIKSEKNNEKDNLATEELQSLEEMYQTVIKNGPKPLYMKCLIASIDMLRQIGAFEYHETLLEKYTKK